MLICEHDFNAVAYREASFKLGPDGRRHVLIILIAEMQRSFVVPWLSSALSDFYFDLTRTMSDHLGPCLLHLLYLLHWTEQGERLWNPWMQCCSYFELNCAKMQLLTVACMKSKYNSQLCGIGSIFCWTNLMKVRCARSVNDDIFASMEGSQWFLYRLTFWSNALQHRTVVGMAVNAGRLRNLRPTYMGLSSCLECAYEIST